MRTLLFTVFGVIAAATAGVSYLALSPAPNQSSDSLKLVIETGSVPATRQASVMDERDGPTGSLNEPASSESGQEPSLDEVIAARLQQAGKGEGATPTAPGEDGGEASATQANTPSPAGQSGGSPTDRAGSSETASATPEADFDAPDSASPPAGTVSITQMLAAELNKGGGDNAEKAPEQQPSREATGRQGGDDAVARSTTSSPAEPSDDSVKTAGRLPQADDSGATGQAADNAATLAEGETTSPGGSASETEIAALDPRVNDAPAPDPQGAQTTAPEAAREQPPAAPDDTAEQPQEQPEALATADSPALPRPRGDFEVKGRIALIIRGLGVSADLTQQSIRGMPQQVAMAFVPYGDDLKNWTQRARQDRHEILLQIPLEPKGYPENNPGPHTLLSSLSIDENLQHLDWLLDRFEGITGVTNYKGEKFASSPGAFAPVLMELKARDLLYIDDSKAANATTRQLAQQVSLAYSVADVVIDSKREPAAIKEKLAELEAQAREDGSAIAIGHAHAATLGALQSWLGSLNDKRLALVPITDLTTAPTARVSQSTGG
jgi:polysaccharide deacetylase 2 family uncharacterized protein YibQ